MDEVPKAKLRAEWSSYLHQCVGARRDSWQKLPLLSPPGVRDVVRQSSPATPLNYYFWHLAWEKTTKCTAVRVQSQNVNSLRGFSIHLCRSTIMLLNLLLPNATELKPIKPNFIQSKRHDVTASREKDIKSSTFGK